MSDYTKAKIYKITNDYNDDVYVGSTCDTLIKRFSYHKKDSKKDKKKNSPLYKLMNEIGFERFRIQLLEDYHCEDKYQLRQREGYYIREQGTLNKLVAGRTDKEYREENKEKISEKDKKYREENKDKIKEYYEANKEKLNEYKKEYNKENKEQIKEYQKEYRETNKEKIKEYREANREKIAEYKKEYREQNKEKISEKILCVCGCLISKRNLSTHKKTNKHINFLKQD